MASTRYGDHVIRKSVTKTEPWPTLEFIGATDYKSNVTFMITLVNEPCAMEEFPHSHDFDMYLHFVSTDSSDMNNLHAEIEIGLGPEREIHVINTPASVYIPKGMVHCPLIFKRIDRPLYLFHTSIASQYLKDPQSIIKD